jgi:hypothetical protein
MEGSAQARPARFPPSQLWHRCSRAHRCMRIAQPCARHGGSMAMATCTAVGAGAVGCATVDIFASSLRSPPESTCSRRTGQSLPTSRAGTPSLDSASEPIVGAPPHCPLHSSASKVPVSTKRACAGAAVSGRPHARRWDESTALPVDSRPMWMQDAHRVAQARTAALAVAAAAERTRVAGLARRSPTSDRAARVRSASPSPQGSATSSSTPAKPGNVSPPSPLPAMTRTRARALSRPPALARSLTRSRTHAPTHPPSAQ